MYLAYDLWRQLDALGGFLTGFFQGLRCYARVLVEPYAAKDLLYGRGAT